MGSTSDIMLNLDDLSSDDKQLFQDIKSEWQKKQIKESPLLDQLCWVQLIRRRLSDSFAKALLSQREKLEKRAKMPSRWRESPTIKSPEEFEGPMPWLHPYKMAGEALAPLEQELKTAINSGDTNANDISMLGEVLSKHNLKFPLASDEPIPRFPPRSLRFYK